MEDQELQNTVDEERKAFHSEIESLTLRYEAASSLKDKQLAELLSELAQAKQDFAHQLQLVTSERSSKVASLSSKISELHAALTAKTQELAQLNQHLGKVNSALTESQHKLVAYHAETTRFAQKLELSLAQKEKLIQDAENKEGQIKSLEKTIQELRS